MAPSPRKRMASPRKRLPPTPFNQTWHETDTAHLDPNALPVARIPRGWERKREVKQIGEGKEKSIWRRFNLRSSNANAAQEETEEEEEQDARSRAVKRRQRLSPKAMEKMQGNKRAFKGTRWDRRKSVLPRKKVAHADEILLEAVSDSDDTQAAADANMGDESISEAAQILEVQERPSSFKFSVEAQTVDDLPASESADEQDDDTKLDNLLPEDSTFALIFRSPVKTTQTPVHISPAKIVTPLLPAPSEDQDVPAVSYEQLTVEDVTVEGPTVDSVVKEVVSNLSASTTYLTDAATSGTHAQRMADTTNSETDTATDNVTDIEDSHVKYEKEEESSYPTLATGHSLYNQSVVGHTEHVDEAAAKDEEDDAEMSDIQAGDIDGTRMETSLDLPEDESVDDEFTEASLQLDIQENYEKEGQTMDRKATNPSQPEHTTPRSSHDITNGLTLTTTPAKASSVEHTPKKLHSPPPPLRIDSGADDATMTIGVDDDTAILKSFLSRAAASKAERAAFITRRESLGNRRDSDIVRHALASPRKALEQRDPNSPSRRYNELTLEVSETSALSPENDSLTSPTSQQPGRDDLSEARSERGSRRSSRAKKSRLPAPAAPAQNQTSKIAIRRADGTDPVVLKKTDAQELALITRNNTRKNKQGAFMVSLRLLKLQAEAILSPPTDLDNVPLREPVPGKKSLQWDETLAYYQEHADTIAAQLAEAESLATPDELSLPAPAPVSASTGGKKPKAQVSTDKNSTPKIRRVRGLGTANGTPGKGLLSSASLLPDSVQAEQQQPPAEKKSIPKPKINKKHPVASTPANSKLETLEITPVGVEPVKERKSRLAPPKSIKMPRPVATVTPVPAAEKENTRTGITGATPRKGIPAPKIVAPRSTKAPAASAGVESGSGLPRRRGRKV